MGLAWFTRLQVAAASMSGSVPSKRLPPLRKPSQTAAPPPITASSACHCQARWESARFFTRLFRCARSVCWPSSFSRTSRSNSASGLKARGRSTKGMPRSIGAVRDPSFSSVGFERVGWAAGAGAGAAGAVCINFSSCVACWRARIRDGSVGGSAT